jgi:NADPH2:quinone reductase
MKIIQFKTPGGPSVLDYVEVPTPEPKEGEVLVRAHAIGVGMPDIMIRRGTYNWMPPLPGTPGTEMSGVVEKIGPASRPCALASASWCRRATAASRRLLCRVQCDAGELGYALPDGADMDQAAALANYQVAYHLLYDCITFKKGQSVLIRAAAAQAARWSISRAMRARHHRICGGATKVAFVKSPASSM